jgi:hypothetical protein
MHLKLFVSYYIIVLKMFYKFKNRHLDAKKKKLNLR